MANFSGSACVASIFRVVALNWVDSNDLTYTVVPEIIWGTIEQCFGIVCACLPITWPLFRHLLHSIKHAFGHSHKLHIACHAPPIPLGHYSPRAAVDGSTHKAREGFSRLSEENMIGFGSVTAHASQSTSDDLPVVPERIVRQQNFEQHVEIR